MGNANLPIESTELMTLQAASRVDFALIPVEQRLMLLGDLINSLGGANLTINVFTGNPPDDRLRFNRNKGQLSGKAEAKLKAAFTLWHRFDGNQGIDNSEPVGLRAIAKTTKVAPNSATRFFRVWFGSHKAYVRLCATRNYAGLLYRIQRMYGIERISRTHQLEYGGNVTNDKTFLKTRRRRNKTVDDDY